MAKISDAHIVQAAASIVAAQIIRNNPIMRLDTEEEISSAMESAIRAVLEGISKAQTAPSKSP